MIGIYKITSPSKRVYIGQSTDIYSRWNNYIRWRGGGLQSKLMRSFKKYGVDNHIFEVIEECSIESLNERERYWQDFYDVINVGLNCLLTKTNTRSGKMSKETILKKSLAVKGNKHPNWGKKLSEETCRRISESNKNKKISKDHRQKLSNSLKGKPKPWMREITGLNHHSSTPIISKNSLTGEIYKDNITGTALYLKCNKELIVNRINGISGKRPFRKLKEWNFSIIV